MANKRTLKHTINCVCSGMFAECMLMLRLGNKVDRDNIHALLRAIVVINSDYVRGFHIPNRE